MKHPYIAVESMTDKHVRQTNNFLFNASFQWYEFNKTWQHILNKEDKKKC